VGVSEVATVHKFMFQPPRIMFWCIGTPIKFRKIL